VAFICTTSPSPTWMRSVSSSSITSRMVVEISPLTMSVIEARRLSSELPCGGSLEVMSVFSSSRKRETIL
jgi:hypothetical protein